MTGSAQSGLIDQGQRVYVASLSLVSALRLAHPTAVQIRSEWLRLALTYRTPEADLVLRAMERPTTAADDLRVVADLAHSALLAYADRLGELERWPATTAAEVLAIRQARVAAELACGAALQAITRPEPGSPVAAAATLHPCSNPSLGDAQGKRWVHPEESSGTFLARLIDGRAGWAPPVDEDRRSRALYASRLLALGGATTADWMITVEHGTFRPRGATGRYVPIRSLNTTERLVAGAGSVSRRQGLNTTQRLRTFTPGGTFEAKGHRGTAHRQWTAASGRWARANSAITAANSGWVAWQDNKGYATDERIGRTAAQGAAVAGGTIAGGQTGALIGSAIGTAIMPGAGTLVGATIGSLVGGFAGSELGGWVGDQIVDVGGEAGDLIGDSLEWVGDQSRDAGATFVDAVTFWD